MNTVALSGTLRKAVGTKDAAQLRREKRVPCVLYGSDKTVHFSVEEADLRKVVFTPEVNGIELDLEGTKTLALVQEKQFHPLTDRVIHIDFLQLDPSKETTAVLSVRLLGQPAGVRAGGKLSQPMRKVRVKALPSKMPQHLEINVADLGVNQSIKVSDLKFDGLTILDLASSVVVSVKMTKKEQVAEGAAAPAKGAAPAKAAAKK